MARDGKNDREKIGHNSNVSNTDATALKAYRLQHDQFDEQRTEITADRRAVRNEMREKGFDLKAFDEARRRSKLSETLENATEAYQLALGILKDTPLGQAAMARDLPGGAEHASASSA
jgi:uncharacterized protein (UPF0335 family)